METKKTVLAIITKTILLQEIVLLILLSSPFLSFGQQVKEDHKYSFGNKNNEEYELTSFKCKSIKDKVYIMWTVLESSNECIYRLERSDDDKTYKTIYALKSSKSPNSMELLNSFIDNEPLNGSSYYRVRRFSKETVIVSRTYVVNRTITPIDSVSVQKNEEIAGRYRYGDTYIKIDMKIKLQ